MADVSFGPVSSMPGSRHKMPDGATCDTHHPRPAVKRVQGETDSFGCEYLDLCQECIDEIDSHYEAQRNIPRYCQWCKGMKLRVRPYRDYDEGMAGPLYDVCGDCVTADHLRAAEELAENPGSYAVDDDYFDDDSEHDADDPAWNESDGQGPGTLDPSSK